MKLSCLTLTAALALCSGAAIAQALTPQQAQQEFSAANDLGLEGDFKGAAALYSSLLQRGVRHPDLHYNLGNAYAAQAKDVEAVIEYERALRMDPGHEDAAINLARVRKRLKVGTAVPPAESEPTVALADVLGPMLAPFPTAIVAWGAALAQALFFLAWWWARRSRSQGSARAAGRAAIVLAGVALVLGLMTAGQAFVAHEPVAVAGSAFSLRQGPDERFDSSGSVSPGARLRVMDSDGRWRKVLQQDGLSGWTTVDKLSPL